MIDLPHGGAQFLVLAEAEVFGGDVTFNQLDAAGQLGEFLLQRGRALLGELGELGLDQANGLGLGLAAEKNKRPEELQEGAAGAVRHAVRPRLGPTSWRKADMLYVMMHMR